MDLTAEDLIGLGVASIGHRRKLLAAIAALRAGSILATTPATAPRRRLREGLGCKRGRAPPAHRDVCRPGRVDRARGAARSGGNGRSAADQSAVAGASGRVEGGGGKEMGGGGVG